jgi:hypothetical protein
VIDRAAGIDAELGDDAILGNGADRMLQKLPRRIEAERIGHVGRDERDGIGMRLRQHRAARMKQPVVRRFTAQHEKLENEIEQSILDRVHRRRPRQSR